MAGISRPTTVTLYTGTPFSICACGCCCCCCGHCIVEVGFDSCAPATLHAAQVMKVRSILYFISFRDPSFLLPLPRRAEKVAQTPKLGLCASSSVEMDAGNYNGDSPLQISQR